MHHQLLNLESRGGAHRVLVGSRLSLLEAKSALQLSITPGSGLMILEKKGFIFIVTSLKKEEPQPRFGRAKISVAREIVAQANEVLCLQ